MRNLYAHIAELATQDSKKIALAVCDEQGRITRTINRIELLGHIEQAAGYLAGRGLTPGDRVALNFDNSAEFLILSWAAWASGIVTVPLDRKRDTEELTQFKLTASNSKFVISGENYPDTSAHSSVQWSPTTSHEALVLFTSGTTAHPKGALLTLDNLIVNATAITEWLHIEEKDCFLVQLPLHHINSTTFSLSAMLAGACIAIPPRYSHSHFWRHVAGTGATYTSVVPSIIFDQLTRTSEYIAVKDKVQLSRIQIGSAPVVAKAVQEFINTFGVPLFQGYGQTETALRVTGVPMDLSPEQYAHIVAENSIGTPMPWAEVEVADEDGILRGEGEEGEVVIKGGAIMRGYIGGEVAFRDGWFLTGDIGFWKKYDSRRFFFLKGRRKEIIIKGGVNISPIAVENALRGLTSEIGQAYVVGVPDARYGEEIGAFIVWKKGVPAATALRKLRMHLLMETEHISAYETPKYIATIEQDKLPLTSTGKVQRIFLRQQHSNALAPLEQIETSDAYTFEMLSTHSPLVEASRTLFNHCWQPLSQTPEEYLKYLKRYHTLVAIDKQGVLGGQISFELKESKLVCVSICSANFIPKPIPNTASTPTLEEVKAYLLEGHDPVMNFHQKLGATLVEVIPNGRPNDNSSLGYTMLLQYPPLSETITKINNAPLSHQLIEVARLLGRDLEKEVFALSRPGGLASYLQRAT